jgi:hypothetical protein
MLYKRCVKCKEEKSVLEFNKNKSKKDGLHNYCRSCNKARMKSYYREHKQEYLSGNKIRVKKLKSSKRKAIDKYKRSKGCCIDGCNEKEPCSLDLHHIQKNKEKGISQLICDGASWRKILLEVKKCIVVCANHHRKIHHNIISI